MKKMIIGVAMLLFANVGFGQVSDNAVIPVSVTLNSILRLTVVSGGNIQFVVNTIENYTAGIKNSDRYITKFNVASSRNFDVFIYAESSAFYGMNYDGGTATTGNSMDLRNVGFLLRPIGAATFTTNAASSLVALSADDTTPILDEVLAGSSLVNEFDIEWELATPALQGVSGLGSLLSQNIPADTYVTNVFINIAPN